MRARILLGLAVAVVLVAGCGSPAPIAEHKPPGTSSGSTSASSTSSSGTGGAHPGACTPGAQVACACVGGGEGAQVCDASGTSYGPCACPDAGAGGATSTSSSSSAASSSSSGAPMLCTDSVQAPEASGELGASQTNTVVWAYSPSEDIEASSFQVTLNNIEGVTWFLDIFADDGSGTKPASPPVKLATSASVAAGSDVAIAQLSLKKGTTYWIGVGTDAPPPQFIYVTGDNGVMVPFWSYDGTPNWSSFGTSGRPGIVVTGACP